MKKLLMKAWGRAIYNANKLFFPDFNNDFYLANKKQFSSNHGPLSFLIIAFFQPIIFHILPGIIASAEKSARITPLLPAMLLGSVWCCVVLMILNFFLITKFRNAAHGTKNFSNLLITSTYILGIFVLPFLNLVKTFGQIKRNHAKFSHTIIAETYINLGFQHLIIGLSTLILFHLINRYQIKINQFAPYIHKKSRFLIFKPKPKTTIKPLMPHPPPKDWRITEEPNFQTKELSKILD